MTNNDTPIVLRKWHFLSRAIRRCRGKNEFRVPQLPFCFRASM